MEVAGGRVAFVFFAKTHMPVPVAFSHAGVIDHEEVDVEVVRARSLDLVVFCKMKGCVCQDLG